MYCGHVVLFDFPRDPSEYVRRVGRTARGAGGTGVVSALVLGRQVGVADGWRMGGRWVGCANLCRGCGGWVADGRAVQILAVGVHGGTGVLGACVLLAKCVASGCLPPLLCCGIVNARRTWCEKWGEQRREVGGQAWGLQGACWFNAKW